MSTDYPPTLTRRQLFLGVSAGALATALPARRGPTRAANAPELQPGLTAAPGRASLVGPGHLATQVWACDGSMPGPVLRVRQGAPFRINVANWLDEDTTVHWHGIRLPNAMDGVPGLTQPPIRPGGSFTYEFTPPDAGTFWYHPHADSLCQLGRGLAGALIVEEHEPVGGDRDLLWVVQDWRLEEDAQIAPGFGNRMEAAMSGRVGNTVTINGRVPDAVQVQAGERVRLRLVNAAMARILGLCFEGHRPVVVAYDGQPCDPHPPDRGRLVLGPAMRADLVLDMRGTPGRRYAVRDDFYGDELAYTLVELAYEPGKPTRNPPPEGAVRLPANPLPEPDLDTRERHEIAIQGGMMSGMGMGTGMSMGMMGGGGASWAINGMSMTGDGEADMKPLFTLPRGKSCVLALRNETAWWHPMHLHGHSFRVISRNGTPVRRREWHDTMLLPPRENAEIAFVGDNPGDWMFHCHVTDHQVAGLMALLRIA
jgi:FtsP/CotA-like multicopper oxidase with cupredoxin domain